MVEYLVSLSKHAGLDVDKKLAARGQEIIVDGATLASGATMDSCTDCHSGVGDAFEIGADNGGYPELNDYGSQLWLKEFIKDPGTEQFYGDKNKMPAYAEKMSEQSLELLVRWMTGDYAETHVEEYPSLQEELAAAKSKGSGSEEAPKDKKAPDTPDDGKSTE